MKLPALFQDRRVHYAIIAAATLASLALFIGNRPRHPARPVIPTHLQVSGVPDPTWIPGDPRRSPGAAASWGAPAQSAAGFAAGAAAACADGSAQSEAGQQRASKKAGPKPPHQADPFESPFPVQHAALHRQFQQLTETPSLEEELRAAGVPPPDLYATLCAKRQSDRAAQRVRQADAETPEPPMRMAGLLHGPRVQGILEVAGQAQVVQPGDTVGAYRVERIEAARIVLVKQGPGGEPVSRDVAMAQPPEPPVLATLSAPPHRFAVPSVIRAPVPASRATAGSRDGPLWLEYEHFAPVRRLTLLIVHLGPSATSDGEVRLLLDPMYLAYFLVDRVLPAPKEVEPGPDGLAYTFELKTSGEPAEIVFHLRPQVAGDRTGWAKLGSGAPVRFTQTIEP